MEKIYIDRHYDESFLIQQGQNIHSIFVPKDVYSYNINSILLSYSPNVEEFIIEDKNSFEFSNGVLYSKIRDYRNIEYITKAVKSLRIDADVTNISYWHGVDDVQVDSENTEFTVVENMLLSQSGKELYFVFGNAEEAIIPEGVSKIHYHAFEYCRNLKKIEFPETYSWDGWYKPYYKPLWILDDNVDKPEIIVKGNQVTVVNEIILRHDTPKYYFGDSKCCCIPKDIRHTFNFDDVFNSVESFSVSDDHPSFSVVNGILLDKQRNKLLFYPRTRKEFSVPESVSTICSFAVARCNNLEEAVIPETIKRIEGYAFSDCKKLESIILKCKDTIVDLNAFSGCVLTKGDYKVGMEEGVFYKGRTVTGIDCRYEEELKVREGTQSIKKLVGPARPGVVEFGATEVNAETLVVPASVNEIELLLVPLKNIIVDGSNSEFCSVDGILFSKDMRTLIRYPERHNGDKYSVPDSVDTIAEYAFYNCQNLKSITIHENIKIIGENAFCYTNLKTIELPAKSIKIGELAFLANVYSRLSGVKHSFSNTIINFRHGEFLIPLQLIDNWGVNKDEVLLSEFVATADIGRKKSIYSDVKKTEYKRFMALYLAIVFDDADCMKYLLKTKKKIEEAKIYASLFDRMRDTDSVENDSELKDFITKWNSKKEISKKETSKERKVEPATKTPELAVGETMTLGHYAWGDKNEPIRWIVVKATKKQYLLLSAYYLRAMSFYSGPTKDNQLIGWDKSDVREWLNHDFLAASFNDEERKRICESTLNNTNGVDTNDFIFIPGEKERKLINKERSISGRGGPLCFRHENEKNQILGLGEMIRSTIMKNSCCHVKVEVSFSKSIELDMIAFIRPMMWITK